MCQEGANWCAPPNIHGSGDIVSDSNFESKHPPGIVATRVRIFGQEGVWCAPPNVPRSGGIQPTKNIDLQLRLGVQAPPGNVAAHPANIEGGC